METSTNPVRKLPDVRKALKEQQLARVAAKAKVAAGKLTTEEYSKMYASQPAQVEKAEQHATKRAQQNAVKAALTNAAVESAKGATTVFGGKV